MMDLEMDEAPDHLQQTNNNHANHTEHENHDHEERAEFLLGMGKGSDKRSVSCDGDAEVNSIISNSSRNDNNEKGEGEDLGEMEVDAEPLSSNNCSPLPLPPRKIARRSKDRRSASSPRLKTPTPVNSWVSTPAGSSSEREPNSSPASIDNPPTNGSVTNDTFGDGDRSDRTESGDSQSVSSLFHSSSANGTALNHVGAAFTKRNVTLQMLLAAGVLKPGEGTMSLEYHGQKFVGDLQESGIIRSQETSQEFSSPSAWAIACKQIINPEKILKKSGCGWASIKYKGLKLDYYKTVWFKRLREGSIDVKHFANGTSPEESDEDDVPFCLLKFGEHLEGSPVLQSAQQVGAKVFVKCSSFEEIDRLQPFYVKISSEALALADFHCNLTGGESLGYISGKWSSEDNCLTMELAHPCKVVLPNSTSIDCDLERNRIAEEIQGLGHDVVGWYHSHPKAPPQPSTDDVTRQLDYQIVMKGASDSNYIPCVGVIISPACYSNQEDLRNSPIQLYWVMPPPENRPSDLGRPMHIEYSTFSSSNLNIKKLLLEMESLLQFYKSQKDSIEVTDFGGERFEKLQESFSSILPEAHKNFEFWDEVKHIFSAPMMAPVTCANSTGSSTDSPASSSALNSVSISPATPFLSSSTPPIVPQTVTKTEDPPISPMNSNGDDDKT